MNPKQNIHNLELTEFLRAFNFAQQIAESPSKAKDLANTMREHARQHRFDVMSWLMANGVTVPGFLLADQMHVVVGQQSVDKPMDHPNLPMEG